MTGQLLRVSICPLFWEENHKLTTHVVRINSVKGLPVVSIVVVHFCIMTLQPVTNVYCKGN